MDSEIDRIIKKVIRKLRCKNSYNTQGAEQAFIVTGFHPKFLNELLIHSSKYLCINNVEELDRSVIYQELINFYKKNKMPTTKELFLQLYGKIPKLIDIAYFRKVLVKMGFVWIKVNDNNCVVFEKPLITFKRYEYLKKIIDYRNEGKRIVYINEIAFDSLGNCYDVKKSHSINTNDLSRWIYATTQNGIFHWQKINDFKNDDFHNYVVDLSRNCSEPSVFVYDNSNHHNQEYCKQPTVKSLKLDLIRWLEIRNIPFDSDASKYSLYALAQRHMDIDEKIYKLDQILEAEGHAVLRLPKFNAELSPGFYIETIVKNSVKEQTKNYASSSDCVNTEKVKFDDNMFVDILKLTTPIDIQNFDIEIQEAKQLRIDIKIDKIMDDLRESAKHATYDSLDVDSDLPSCSDSE